jgi:hypothetical protein
VVVVAAAVIVIQHTPRMPRTTAASSASAPGNGVPMPVMMFPDALFRQMTADLQAGNETGFLNMASAPARPALKNWWDNLHAIGFTTGAVVPTASQDMVRIDRQGDGSTVVLAGVHSPLDPLYNGANGVPMQRYRIGLHFASPTATGLITSWQPVSADPWDQAAGLYVRKDTNVVVAGLKSDSGLVDETLPLAQAAATYDMGLVHQANPNDLFQEGFVVFVSGSAAARDSWFAAGPQPGGWPLEWNGDRVFQLPGPGTSPDDYTSAPAGVADDSTGGARVVIAPYQQSGQTPQGETLGLEREFMIDILAAHDQNLVNGPAQPAGPPAWALQGLGIAVEALYLGDNNPAPASYDFGPLASSLHTLPAAYRTGKLPGARQLAGPSAQNWNDVAASVYYYIEQKYGINQMLGSAMLLWTRFNTPFGNVEDAAQSSGSTFVFFTSATVEAGWRAWLAQA